MDCYFIRGLLVLPLIIEEGHSYDFVSLFRGSQELVAPEMPLTPEEMEPAAYEELVRGVPGLREHMRWPRASYEHSQAMFDRNVSYNNTTLAEGDAWKPSDSWNASDPLRKGIRRVATCYVCNVQNAAGAGIRGLPEDTLCHDAWASSDWRIKRMKRYFRTHCYYRPGGTWDTFFESKDKSRYDRSPMRGMYGNYMGGCYKRYLDIGKVYTVRGCRLYRPTHWTGGYAADRFRFLELLLRHQADACIVSPHASLTPFSRAVSLYVRYHVCVCSTKYCNAAPPAPAPPSPRLHLLLLIYITLPLYTFCLNTSTA